MTASQCNSDFLPFYFNWNFKLNFLSDNLVCSCPSDYDEKAEDAVDYEDIDEQYDGPEVQAGTEEDHLLPKKEFFSSNVSLASLNHKASVFDEENYDEDEETVKEDELDGNNVDVRICPSAGHGLEPICIFLS